MTNTADKLSSKNLFEKKKNLVESNPQQSKTN